MRDLFTFAAAQDLTGVDSTGVVSDNIWDLEADDAGNATETDSQVVGWLNVLFRASNAGATEGLWVELRTSDNTDIDTTHEKLGALFLTDAQLTAAAGKTFSIGVSVAGLKKYVGVWFRADTTSLAATATPVDAWLSIAPEGLSVTQKQPS